MSITAEDINYLIFRYLQESGADTQKTRMPMIANQVETEAQCAGMIHTAYAFEIESQVGKADVAHEDIDNGCLIKLLQRGLQYMELEANADSSTFEVLTAADILKAKSTEQLKSVVREKREERDNSDEQPAPRQFEEDACRIVTTAEAFSASWNPEGTKLATYVHENTAQIWTAGTTMEYKILEPMSACPLVHGPKTDSLESVIVTRLIWAPDGQNVTTGCSDGTICTWSSSGDLRQTCKVHTDQISHLSYSDDGKMLLASSEDHPATLWDPQLKSELGRLDGIREPINNACWCGPNLATTDSRFEIHLHTANLDGVDKADLQHMRTWSGHSDCVVDIDWAPNQWLLASCSEDRTVRLWGTHQTSELCSLIDDDGIAGQAAAAHVDEASVCIFRPAGPGSHNPNLSLQLASADQQGIVKLWDCDGGRLLHSLQGHKCRVYTLAWSPDGSMLATGCLQGILVIWDVHSGNVVKQCDTGAGFFELSWNADGQRLAGAAKDGVKIWDVRQ